MFMGVFSDLLIDDEANATAQDFFHRKLREAVPDQDIADRLMPDFSLGCKRLIVGSNYYETYNRPNVSLVSLKESPIEKIDSGTVYVMGEAYPVDAV